LRRYVVATGGHLIEMTFVSNLDSDDLLDGLRDLDLTQTLVVVVSKSGATLETSMNSELLSDVAFQQGISYEALDAQTIVVTSKDSVLDVAGRFMDIFYIDDAIGGRFSLTSAVGAVGLSCAFGSAIFDRFLFGASELDRYAEQPFIESNMVMLNAWIGVCDRHFFGASSKAVVAYAEGLSHFVSHLQQLDCESNGKSVNRQGQKVSYPTGPMVWGGVGSSVQHSFFQWLHQAGNESSIQLIGCRRPQLPGYTSAYSHQRLIQNMVAQWMAFSRGEACPEDANRHFEGNRSVSVVMMDQLTPETCGALVSFYENTIMFQGFIWDINSFDQEGVQLGKRLSTQLDDGSADDRLNALYHSLLY
jgi:glucose-6-phosphate isomerase